MEKETQVCKDQGVMENIQAWKTSRRLKNMYSTFAPFIIPNIKKAEVRILWKEKKILADRGG